MLDFLKKSRQGTFLILCLFFCSTFSLQSHPLPQFKRWHAPALTNDSAGNDRAQGLVHIVAVMAEFQAEENRFTTGNGTFELPFLEREEIVIDPPPHNQGHFEAHLEFAQHYFQTVSDGRLEIEYQVVPEVIQLDHPMRYYSPVGEDNLENKKLANLARDTWQKAVELPDFPDLSKLNPYKTLFIIFHAGSGRNIELMGTSLHKTPQDIPSVYLGRQSLERLLEQPGFKGFETGQPGIRITNTAILPQTQSRTGEDVTGREYVLQLSINGLLAANIGSFLGLPDLFNTLTGASGIGRFGLMDGASIFSYLGLFPPEPSAWEKIHLGWQTPFDISLNNADSIVVPAASLRRPESIARHRISADEHFLVENRHRNPANEPLEVTIRTPDNRRVTHRIDPADIRFDPFDISAYREIMEAGVLVGVSNYDWSLPGGPIIDTDPSTGFEEKRILNGGILIWHIDEAVIRSSLADNRVNANENRRGVLLMEADGSQDIGRPPGTDQTRFVNGHAFDFWWKYNDFTVITARGDTIVVYQDNGNRFGPDTQPSNASHSGSPSFFEFYDFSDNLPMAWFRVRSTGGTYTRPVTPALPGLDSQAAFHRYYESYPVSPEIIYPDEMNSPRPQIRSAGSNNQNSRSDISQTDRSDPHLLIPAPEGFFILNINRPDSGYSHLEHPWPSSPLIHPEGIVSGQILETQDPLQDVGFWSYDSEGWNQKWRSSNVESGPGLISFLHPDTLLPDRTALLLTTTGDKTGEKAIATQLSADINGVSAWLEEDRVKLPAYRFEHLFSRRQIDSNRKYAGHLLFDKDSGPAFFLLTDDQLDILDYNTASGWSVRTIISDQPLSWPAFGDWTGDRSADILITDNKYNQVLGFNRDGGRLDFFPLSAPQGVQFSGSPLLADITGDGRQELIIASRDSFSMTIHAYDRYLQKIEEFPLLVGGLGNQAEMSSPALLVEAGRLFAIAPSGEVRAWELPLLGDIEWGRVYGNHPGNKTGYRARFQRTERKAFGILNKTETYNWPNPATDHTYIRYETSKPSDVDITVIHPGGSVIYTLQTRSSGRYPEEVLLDTSSWGNGVYFARVRARSESQSDSRIIKIVVTH